MKPPTGRQACGHPEGQKTVAGTPVAPHFMPWRNSQCSVFLLHFPGSVKFVGIVVGVPQDHLTSQRKI